jgi:predicted Zn-dependent protease with MMP-like domain
MGSFCWSDDHGLEDQNISGYFSGRNIVEVACAGSRPNSVFSDNKLFHGREVKTRGTYGI